MANPPAPPLEARGLLRLARSDRAAAGKAIGELSLDAQVALVCETTVSQRSALLDLMPEPEAVIPRMPEAELCFTVKALGIHDAPWILECATPEQVVACVDLDAWQGALPDRAALDSWLDALAETSADSFLRSVQALDAELVVLYLRQRIAVELKPNNDDWEPPDGAQTLEGQFYFAARRQDDDIAAIVSLMRQLFQHDYWTYFRMMQGAIWELDSECEEWAFRWRMGRLEDLGFPPWDEAMRVYRYMSPEERSQIPEDANALDVDAWRLPVWIPGLPTESEDAPLIFRTLAQLEERERNAAFFAFVALANKLAVADRMSLSDAESLPRAIEKAAHFASEGLTFVSGANAIDAVETVRRVPLETLFRVGANLDPQAARPT